MISYGGIPLVYFKGIIDNMISRLITAKIIVMDNLAVFSQLSTTGIITIPTLYDKVVITKP